MNTLTQFNTHQLISACINILNTIEGKNTWIFWTNYEDKIVSPVDEGDEIALVVVRYMEKENVNVLGLYHLEKFDYEQTEGTLYTLTRI